MGNDTANGKAHVLLVDDEEDFLFAMKTWLTHKGFNVETAGGGREGLEKLKQHRPDVVFVDVKMPEMDGIDTLAQIRAMDEELPVILITAFGLNPRIQEAERYNVTGFFRKSQEFDRAAAMIEEAVRKVKES